MIQKLLAFIVTLGVLVVFHELGHYLVARLAGVKVLRFSVGFGRIVWSRRFGPDGTEWALSAIPLGGYVKMVEEREGEVAPADLPRAFNRQSVWRRIAIVAAGPIANLLLAVLLFAGVHRRCRASDRCWRRPCLRRWPRRIRRNLVTARAASADTWQDALALAQASGSEAFSGRQTGRRLDDARTAPRHADRRRLGSEFHGRAWAARRSRHRWWTRCCRGEAGGKRGHTYPATRSLAIDGTAVRSPDATAGQRIPAGESRYLLRRVTARAHRVDAGADRATDAASASPTCGSVSI
jgi:hypothetical protein